MSRPTRRGVDAPTAAALVVLLPAVVTALVVLALEAGRARQPDDPLFDGPPPRSLARYWPLIRCPRSGATRRRLCSKRRIYWPLPVFG